jgi:hypothetical protein
MGHSDAEYFGTIERVPITSAGESGDVSLRSNQPSMLFSIPLSTKVGLLGTAPRDRRSPHNYGLLPFQDSSCST